MRSVIVLIFRFIAGIIMLWAIWFVFDKIHDRNTEIIVSMIGLLYAFIFMISRRMQYFGLTIFSFFGRTRSYIQNIPYDGTLREEIGLQPSGQHLYLNAIFSALIELLCLFRLFTSLLGRGWGALSDPIRAFLHSAPF